MNGNIQNALLIHRIKNGENELAQELIINNYDRVYKYIRYKTGDEHLAYDLTQEVFLRLLTGIISYREKSHFNAYLMRIAHNVLVDYFKLRKEASSIEDIEFIPQINAFEDTVSDKDAVRRALMKLPLEQREAVLLKFVAGLKSREIAEITNSNVATVKSRIHLGKEKLKIILKEEGLG
ncbi:MAG: RNA polymerase sigma factor [Clostridia bacterium]|nr:RNA polymerase sigma factor [Clostridia bacterium]